MSNRGPKKNATAKTVKKNVKKLDVHRQGQALSPLSQEQAEVGRGRFKAKPNSVLDFGSTHANRVYEELVATEVSYLNSVNVLTPAVQADILARYDNLKMTPQEKAKYVSKEELAERFEKLNEIKTQQENLLGAFGHLKLNANGEWVDSGQDAGPDAWIAALQAMEKTYGEYARMLQKMEYPPEIENSVPQKDNMLNLSSILITPIQRAPRYVLLGAELSKNTDSGNGNYAGCVNFHTAAKEFAATVDKMKAKAEDAVTLTELNNAISIYNKNPSTRAFTGLLEVLDNSKLSADETASHLNRVSFGKMDSKDHKMLMEFVDQAGRKTKEDENRFLRQKVVNDKVIVKFEEMMKSTKNKTEKAFIESVLQELAGQKLGGKPLDVGQATLDVTSDKKGPFFYETKLGKVSEALASEADKIKGKYLPKEAAHAPHEAILNLRGLGAHKPHTESEKSADDSSKRERKNPRV